MNIGAGTASHIKLKKWCKISTTMRPLYTHGSNLIFYSRGANQTKPPFIYVVCWASSFEQHVATAHNFNWVQVLRCLSWNSLLDRIFRSRSPWLRYSKICVTYGVRYVVYYCVQEMYLSLTLEILTGTKPNTTKLLLFRCEDWTDESYQEDIYVDIRAYGTSQIIALHGMEPKVFLNFSSHSL